MRQDSGSPGSVEKTTLPTTNGYVADVTKSRPTPWYRTTKGIAIIIVVAFVVVGVIVGVAVGVTQSMKNKSTVQEPGRSGGGVQTKTEEQAQPTVTSSIAIRTSAGSGGAGGNENNGTNTPNTNIPNTNNGNTPISTGVPPSNGD